MSLPSCRQSYFYEGSFLPSRIQTASHGLFEEVLSWDPAGRLLHVSSPFTEEKFSYQGGHLVQDAEGSYLFEQGALKETPYSHTSPQRELQINAFGQVISIKTSSSSWQATYHALGRRLQMRYTSQDQPPQEVLFFYDPENDLEELALKTSSHTYWKVQGHRLEAIIDDTGQ